MNEYDVNVLPKPGVENGDTDRLSTFQVFHTFFSYEQIRNLVRTAQVPEEVTKVEEAKLKRQAKNYRKFTSYQKSRGIVSFSFSRRKTGIDKAMP